MNVNEYAKRVLFSDDLEEKLRLSSDTIEFDFQQVKISSAVQPGRPADLGFNQGKSGARFSLPSRPSLVDDKQRGALLHFFANHELLAAELMALALLKFPEAPEPFRRGLFQTLIEEQKHTLWYLGRMRECGVSMGEYPVSGFFWNTVSTMAEPIDYVSRLSLTFEQANLDYSRHFAAIMKQVGDHRTARIMEKIYRDEINHVSYGLEWFREWKQHDQTDWQAYQQRLALPLSPSRAKGNGTTFNREGRQAAGLSDEFIRQLSVFEKSKGRTPNLFYFNPDAEDRITAHSRGETYSCGSKVNALVEDLEILQIFLARKDDVILMRKPPSLVHLERLNDVGFQLPEIIPFTSFKNQDSTHDKLLTTDNRQINQMVPWSAAPDLPTDMVDSSAAPEWQAGWEQLFSKGHLGLHLKEWVGDSVLVEDRKELQKVASNWATKNGLVIKLPISAAGRGVMFIRSADEIATNKKLGHWFDKGSLVVEPWHERAFDFSVQFQIDEQQIRQLGLIRQSIDAKTGRYRGSVSSPKFCKGLPEELARFLMQQALPSYDQSSALCDALFRWARRVNYSGPLGIDAYLYRDESGQLKHRAVCELNPRYTMGRVTHEIRRQVAPGHAVRLAIAGTKNHTPDETGLGFKNSRICSGSICVNEITPTQTQFAATITVDKRPENL